MEITSDGHGFIGKLVLENGECINVSLPSDRSRRLLGKPPQPIKVMGQVLRYPT